MGGLLTRRLCFFSPSVVSFPGPLRDENLLNVPKPLPKQLWETKEVGGQLSSLSLNVCPSEVSVKSYRGFGGKKAEQKSGDKDRRIY